MLALDTPLQYACVQRELGDVPSTSHAGNVCSTTEVRNNTMSRPFGVLVLGALAIAIAVIRLLIGFQLLGIAIFSDVSFSGTGVVWTGLLTIVVGIIWLAVGWALWSMRPWALVFLMIMAVFGLVDAMFVLIASGSIAYGIAAAAIPAFVLWYVSREDVRDQFAAAEMAQYATNPQATGNRDTEGPPDSA
jgi:hypothetical protein